jgi:uncharacterized protein YukE
MGESLKLMFEDSETERNQVHKKSLVLMDQLKACKREESVLESANLVKSISALHSTLTKTLGDIRSHIKRSGSTTPVEDKELHHSATKLNRELDDCKSNLKSLNKSLMQINERGILDWSEVLYRD